MDPIHVADDGMIYRQLGRCGLRVSAISLGTMTFGGAGVFAYSGTTDVAGARRLIDVCLEAGVNLLDTADFYSAGLSERIIGEAIAGRRGRLLVATKCGMTVGPGPNQHGASREHIIRSCEGSLRRLGIDHIDLFQLHQWDGLTRLEETIDTLDALVRSGKVRYVGCSNYSGWHLMKALWTASALGRERFVSQQIHYSLLAREAEYELVPIALDQEVGVLAWSPLSGGLLTGKYRLGRPPPAGARFPSAWVGPPPPDPGTLEAIVGVLTTVAGRHGATVPQVALAWLLQRPGVSSLVIGARDEAQLVELLASVDVSLSAADVADLDAASAPPLIYPFWQQRNTGLDQMGPFDLVPCGR
jgi:aryl-alcohol dehydrogenase-like predicted oxidoreductase